MSKHLDEWTPSQSAIKLIKLNGLDDRHIENSLHYLKTRSGLDNIDDIDGYDDWNTFFIMFCIKAAGQVDPKDQQ